MKPYLLIVSIILTTLSWEAEADVLNSGPGGFVLEITTVVDKTVEESYAQFLRIDEWWDGDHSWFGSADNFYLEPMVGGCFCEVKGDKQAQHMRVSFVEPNKEVRMLGGLGPLQMLGVHGAMSWKFLPTDDNQTRILHRYAVTGFHEDGLDKLAAVVDSVQTSQVQRLADRLNVR
jgi:hypothetical protein